jgi:sugar/nucleoside kinase (ribokinase family)
MIRSEIDYLLIGHMSADLIPDGRLLGGTVSYAARTAKAFGLRVGVLTSAAEGEPLVDELAEHAEVVALPAEQTTTFENIYTADGRHQYIRGVAAAIGPDDIPPAWLSAPLVHIAPLADEIDSAVIQRFPHARQMLTPQGWLRRWDADGRVSFKRWFEPEAIRALDVVVFSEEDIIEAPEMEGEFARTASNLIVTRSYNGGTYYRQGQPVPYSAVKVEVVEPTGAGDVFATSLLAAWHALNGDIDAAILVAADLGARSVTRVGLESAPTVEEVSHALAYAINSPGGET